MSFYRHHWQHELESTLRRKGVLYDLQGNKIRFDFETNSFDFGVYSGRECAMLGRWFFSSNPNAKLKTKTCNFCKRCERISDNEPIYKCVMNRGVIDPFSDGCNKWKHYKTSK